MSSLLTATRHRRKSWPTAAALAVSLSVARISIPPAYRGPLAVLARLPAQDASSLIETVRSLPAYAAVTDIQRRFGDVTGTEGSDVAAALLSLRGLLRTTSADELGDWLASSPDLDLDENARAALRERVTALVDAAAVSTTAVAVDLQTQHQRNYQSARIFTDLRPVFADELAEGPTGAVIVEMLQLQTWNRDGESETMFVALDEKDLTGLQEAVERALQKTEALKRFLKDKDVAYFELEEEQ